MRERGIQVQGEAENYEEISDPVPIKYEDCLMIEGVYSLLDEKKKWVNGEFTQMNGNDTACYFYFC